MTRKQLHAREARLSTPTSMKSESPSRPRTLSRSARYGLMQLTRTMTPELTRSFETSPTRLMFSSRSSALKPRLQFRPCLQPGWLTSSKPWLCRQAEWCSLFQFCRQRTGGADQAGNSVG